ncbi:MAG: nucleotidyltransferase domain-containing protein [Proteobacteria bacterium]|nr:nucleotidyltransferase domain-containing protein [Pseudomonadota bacterium]
MSPVAREVVARSRPRVSLLDFEPAQVRAFLEDRLRGKGVVEAYLFGSFAEGRAGPWSDVDLVVVQPTDAPFVERPRGFRDLMDLGVPVDVLVYTPGEFARLREERSGFWKEFERTKIRLL